MNAPKKPGRLADPRLIDAKRYNVYLDPATHANMLTIGEGLLSLGIRRASDLIKHAAKKATQPSRKP